MLLLQTRGANASNSRLAGGGGGVTIAQDTINRANGTMDSAPGNAMSDGSNTWALGQGGGFSVNTNEAQSDANAAAVQYCDSMSDVANIKVRGVIGTTFDGPIGLVARYDHGNTYYYNCYRKASDAKGYIDRIDVAGTTAIVNSGATTYTTGDEIGIMCEGTTITILKDNASVGSAVDAGGLSTGKAGLYANGIGRNMDDWIAETV